MVSTSIDSTLRLESFCPSVAVPHPVKTCNNYRKCHMRISYSFREICQQKMKLLDRGLGSLATESSRNCGGGDWFDSSLLSFDFCAESS